MITVRSMCQIVFVFVCVRFDYNSSSVSKYSSIAVAISLSPAATAKSLAVFPAYSCRETTVRIQYEFKCIYQCLPPPLTISCTLVSSLLLQQKLTHMNTHAPILSDGTALYLSHTQTRSLSFSHFDHLSFCSVHRHHPPLSSSVPSPALPYLTHILSLSLSL